MIPEGLAGALIVVGAVVLIGMAYRWVRPRYCPFGCAPGKCRHDNVPGWRMM